MDRPTPFVEYEYIIIIILGYIRYFGYSYDIGTHSYSMNRGGYRTASQLQLADMAARNRSRIPAVN